MNLRRNVVALGLLVVVAAALFVWGLFWMLNDPVLAGGMSVTMALPDGAGLKRGDRVQLQGVGIGSVRSVELVPPRGVVVALRLEDVPLAADTRAMVRGDVFGAHIVELVPGTALVRLEPGDTIRGEAAPELPRLVEELGGRARQVLQGADSLLSPRAVGDLHALAAALPLGARELQSAFQELRLAASALRRTAEAAEGAGTGPALANTLRELEGSARSFTAAAGAMERSLGSMASVMTKIDQGQGTLGLLVNDTLLYQDLRGAVRDVRALTADVKERPQRYMRFSVF